MKSLLIINGEEHEVEFLQISVHHKEYEDYETVISLELQPIVEDKREIKNTDEKVEAIDVGKPQSAGIIKPEDEILDLKGSGIDEKLLEDLRKNHNVVIFSSVPDNKITHGSVWAIETRRYEVNSNDPIGSAMRDLVQKEQTIMQTSYGIVGLVVDTSLSIKLVDNGFHLIERVFQLKDKEIESTSSSATV